MGVVMGVDVGRVTPKQPPERRELLGRHSPLDRGRRRRAPGGGPTDSEGESMR